MDVTCSIQETTISF